MKKLLTILCGLLIFSGCQSENSGKTFMEGYTKLESSENFRLSSFSETNAFLKSGDFTGIIYYGYTDCPWCQEAVPVMNEVYSKLNLDCYIYYVDKKAEENADEKLEETAVGLLEKDIDLIKDEEGNPHLYVPEVVVVKDGKVVGHNTGTVEGHDAHERVMTSKEEKELETIYDKMFEEIKNEK